MIGNKYYLSLFLGIFIAFFGNCQTKSDFVPIAINPTIPKIIHFSRNDFKGDPQFWTMCENEDGVFIFGNNDGALVYDGEHWQKINLPNNSSIRSLIKAEDGKIYAGGYNELGTLQKNKYGVYFYTSLLSPLHLETKNFENLWQVHEYKKHIIYRSFTELVVITGKTATQIPADKSFLFSEKVNDSYFVQDANHGIYQLDVDKMELEQVFSADLFSNEELAAILPTANKNIVTLISKSGTVYTGDLHGKRITKKELLFEGLQKDQVTCGIVDGNFDYLIGTLSSKIIKRNASGEVITANQSFSNLSTATIHKLFRTKNQNIWVLQNNGLNFLDYKSPFISIFDQASVYDILIHDKVLYTATNNGVYYADLSPDISKSTLVFKRIESLAGQSWAIQELDNDVIVSHDTGIYKLFKGTAQKIGIPNGFWKLTKIRNKVGLYLGSNYNGLYLIENKEGNWIIKNKINGFDESTRDILADYEPNTYWICHGYKGVYKIHFNSDYTRVTAVDHYTNQTGFKSSFNINVFKWRNTIVFTTNTGTYTYNTTANRFVPFAVLNAILDPSKNTRKLIENGGKTWFIQDDEAGYFETNQKKPKLYKDLFLNLKGNFNRGMESIYPLANNKVIFGTNTGLYLYTTFENQNKNTVPTILSQITYIQNKTTHLIERNNSENAIRLPNQTDILRFEFAAPKMISSTEINYSYKLENIDDDWSSWQRNPYKEYTHLRPGNYTFLVKSRNLAGIIGKETSFEFTILPKWYQTNLAYILYFLLSILLIYYAVNYVKRKIAFERLKSQMEIKKSQQLLELELEKLKLKHDKEEIHKDKLTLQGDIIDKSKELANYTLLLSQKKNIFGELQSDLKLLRDMLKSEEARRKITEIFQKLNQHKIGEEFMEIFDVNFEKIHHDFFEKLKKIDPSLTKRELRLCAFVKMDLTNKEISPLLNISTRGIESARYRVRRKLNVQHEDNFVAFLENLAKNADQN